MARSVVVVEVNGYTIEPGANLEEAYLTDAWIAEANLTGANLTGANLKRADLRRANLAGAQADEGTQWPVGFDPVAAGVIFEDPVPPK